MNALEVVIVFSEEDAFDVHHHNNDHVVIIVKYEEWEIKIVLVDMGSSVDMLYWDPFERLCLDPEDFKPLKGIACQIF